MEQKKAQKKPGRPPLDPAPRVAAILGAAVELFSTRGYAKTDLDSIAGELGLAKGSLYRHFRSKSDLYARAIDFAMGSLAESIAGAVDKQASPTGRLRAVVEAYVLFFRAEPNLARMILSHHGEAVPDAQKAYFKVFSTNAHRLENILREGIKAGEFRPFPVEATTRLLADMLHGSLFDVVHGPVLGGDPIEPAMVADLLLEGLVAQGGST